MADKVAAVIEDVDEGGEVHGEILVAKDEMVEGVREGGEDGHEGEINDEGEIDMHNRINEEDVFAFCGPFFAKKEEVDGG